MGGFEDASIMVSRHFNLHDAERFEDALEAIIANPGLVYYTLDTGNKDRAEILIEACNRLGVEAVGCIASESAAMARYLKREPTPHSQRQVDEDTHNAALLEALRFAREYDDGQQAEVGFRTANIVLIAPSRTGKTPVSMSLAVNHRLKVMNIPFVAGVTNAGEITEFKRQNPSALVVAMVRNASELGARRRQRTRQLYNLNGKSVTEFSDTERGHWQDMEARYFGERAVAHELRAFDRFCQHADVVDIIDVSRTPSEEVVAQIKQRYDAHMAQLATPAVA